MNVAGRLVRHSVRAADQANRPCCVAWEPLDDERFDIAVSEAFIEHHATQIGNSTDCLRRACHLVLLRLCQQMVEAQSQEILEFRLILRDHSVDVP